MRVFRATHDWDGDVPLSCTVVETLAAARGEDPSGADRLSSVVDPDALDALFRPLDGMPSRKDAGRIEFSHDGYRVRVTASGEVTVRPLGKARDGVTSEASFQDALDRLIREAEASGVDVEGGWASLDGDGSREWGIEIFEVRRARGTSEATSSE